MNTCQEQKLGVTANKYLNEKIKAVNQNQICSSLHNVNIFDGTVYTIRKFQINDFNKLPKVNIKANLERTRNIFKIDQNLGLDSVSKEELDSFLETLIMPKYNYELEQVVCNDEVVIYFFRRKGAEIESKTIDVIVFSAYEGSGYLIWCKDTKMIDENTINKVNTEVEINKLDAFLNECMYEDILFEKEYALSKGLSIVPLSDDYNYQELISRLSKQIQFESIYVISQGRSSYYKITTLGLQSIDKTIRDANAIIFPDHPIILGIQNDEIAFSFLEELDYVLFLGLSSMIADVEEQVEEYIRGVKVVHNNNPNHLKWLMSFVDLYTDTFTGVRSNNKFNYE